MNRLAGQYTLPTDFVAHYYQKCQFFRTRVDYPIDKPETVGSKVSLEKLTPQ